MAEEQLEFPFMKGGNMKVYSVTLYYTGTATREIEAPDEDTAEERAIEALYQDEHQNIEVTDAVVQLSSNQYTAEQEAIDDDRRKDSN